jgi:Holliday junction resolvase RusA-like endonuclease
MIKLDIKPLSLNKAYSGRRFKTKETKKYCRDLMILLPKNDYRISAGDKLELTIKYGFSNAACDTDNHAKVFQDVLQDKYNFNDKQIYALLQYKSVVKKGDEYIKFEIKKLEAKQ